MRGAKKNPLQFESDAVTYPLCALGILQMVLGFRDAGSLSAAFGLLAQNPLLGGDPPTGGTWNDGSPLWTYLVGHVVGGIGVLMAVSLVLVPWLELADPTIRGALRGKRDDVYGLFVTFTGLCGSAPLLGPLHKLFNEGIVGHFYHDVSLHGGLPYIALTLLLQLAVTETHFYWLHRAMHTSPWYELFHRSHHVFVPSIATASEAFHPVDLAFLAVGAIWLPMVIPVHHMVFTFILFLNAVYTVFQHAGSRTDLGVWWLTDANTHGIHHDYGRRAINCGSLTSFWDHWCGTYCGTVPPWAVTKWPGKGMPAATGKKTDELTTDAKASSILKTPTATGKGTDEATADAKASSILKMPAGEKTDEPTADAKAPPVPPAVEPAATSKKTDEPTAGAKASSLLKKAAGAVRHWAASVDA